ncbi:MAG: hypothetical protein PHC51_05290 [bacterium]|nr:hypothetical protein [bacterium]
MFTKKYLMPISILFVGFAFTAQADEPKISVPIAAAERTIEQ